MIERFRHLGVSSAPEHLVDRILFFNTVCLLTLAIVGVSAVPNVMHGHWFLLGLNVFYIVAITICFFLDTLKRYVAARAIYLAGATLGLALTGITTGAALQNEHYLLVICAVSFPLFHPSERRYSLLFAFLSLIAYFFLVNMPAPLFRPDASVFAESDKIVNQIGYLSLFVCSLMALSGAYDRAAKLLQDRHRQLMNQARMTSAGTIASHVAHEMNSPLAALQLHLGKLTSDLKEKPALSVESVLGRLGRVEHLAARIAQQVQAVNYLSRSEPKEAFVVIPVSDEIASVLELAGERLRQAKTSFELIVENRGDSLRCRKVAFSQVLLNLINNSVDAVLSLPPENRSLKIISQRFHDQIEISVVDSGPTPTPELCKQIFEPFFTTKPLGRGTGLGLSVSREVVREHGGELYIDESRPTTTFVIRVPAGVA